MTNIRDLLLHPIRLRIVQALLGSPMTPLRLKKVLGDVPQATLYRHVNQLAEGGLIEVVDEQPVRGGVERTYGVVAEAVSLSAEDYRDASDEDHLRYFTTFLGTLIDAFGAYLDEGGIDFEADGVGYRQVPLWLTDEEFTEIAEALRDVLRRALDNPPAEGRRRRLITTIVMPDVRASDQPE
jgi:DNA-binding transcriptional ArsR family regulator